MAKTDNPAVVFDRVTKRYGPTVALDACSFEVKRGEVYGLLGPNGAGKTTALRTLLGLIRADEGSVTAFGHDAWSDPVDLHRRMAYVPGELAVWPNLTGGQILDLLGSLSGGYDHAYRDELIARFNFDPRKRGRSYSKGNRQKVAVIAGLMTRAELLVFDEPTSGLDPLMEATFQECLREAKDRGQTIVLSSHILSEVEAVCDRVGILRKGRVIESGTLEELKYLASLTVEARFSGQAPDVSGIEGVEDVSLMDSSIRLQVRGDVDDVVKALAAREITYLQVREPSLEELFHAYYDEGDR